MQSSSLQRRVGVLKSRACEVLISGYYGVYRTKIPRTNYPEEID